MDNEQIGNLIARSNNQSSTDQIISFEQINAFIAEQASKLTAARRFGGSKFTNFAEIIANSVPYPMINFMTASNGDGDKQKSMDGQIKSALQLENHFASFKNDSSPKGARMANLTFMYKNIDVMSCRLTMKSVIEDHKKQTGGCSLPVEPSLGILRTSPKLQNVPNSSNGIQNGHQPAAELSLGLMQTEAYQDTLAKWNHSFDLIYAKRAFYHYHIGEGVEGGMASEARENAASLERDWHFSDHACCGCCGEDQEGEEE